MKKSVLSIVAIAFAAVSVLSSCDKNDDGYGQSAKTTTIQSNGSTSTGSSTNSGTSSSTDASTTTYTAKYFVENNLAELGTYTVTVSDGTKTATYDLVAQGKQGTYDIGSFTDPDIRKGYRCTVSQPSDKPVKFTVTFTPNDKAKSLNDATVTGCLAYSYTTTKGGVSMTGGLGFNLDNVAGTQLADEINATTVKMSKQF